MSEDKNSKMRTPALATACAVLKGACNKVFDAPVTFNFTYTSKAKGQGALAVVYDGPAPTPDQIKEIQALVNQKIEENLPITVKKVERKEAEAVHGAGIYDLAKPPDAVTELNILEIAGWVKNAVKDGEYLASTGLLGTMTITGNTHRPQKKHVEVKFEVGQGETKPAQAKAATKVPAPAAKAEAAPVAKATPKTIVLQKPLADQAGDLVDYFLQELAKVDASSEEGKKKLREALVNETQLRYNALQNASFAAGAKSAIANSK